MVAKASTSASQGINNSILIDPLVKLMQNSKPRTATGNDVTGKTFQRLMGTPDVSFRGTEPLDTVAKGDTLPAVEIQEGSGPQTSMTMDELMNRAFPAVTNQQAAEEYAKVDTSPENAANILTRNQTEYDNNSDKDSIGSFTRHSDSFTPIVSEGMLKRIDSVVDFVNNPANLAGKSSTVTGLTPPSSISVDPRVKGVKTIPVADAKPEEIAQTVRDNMKVKGNDPGSLRSALYSLNAVKSIDLGHVIKRFTYKGTTDGKVLDPKTDKIEGPDINVDSLVPGDQFLQIASINAEEYFAGTINSDASTATEKTGSGKLLPQVSKNQSSEALGTKIIEDYRNSTGQSIEKDIVKEEAVAIGDFAKTIYQITHPDLVRRFSGSHKGVQTRFQLTPEGHRKINSPDTSAFRRRMLGGRVSRPRVDRLVNSLDVGKIRGKSKGQLFSKASNEATDYFNNVPVVVDKRRLSLFMQTVIPFLMSRPDSRNYIATYVSAVAFNPELLWKLDILGIGSTKVADIELSIKQQISKNKGRVKKGLPEKPVDDKTHEYDKAVLEVLETVKVLAMESDGIKYFNHARQGYSGRIDVTELYFNYLSNKIVRAMIRSPNVYVVRKGNRAEANLRQMYAMILTETDVTSLDDVIEAYENTFAAMGVKKVKGSEALPMIRERLLDQHSNLLEGWGERLKLAYNVTPEGMETNVDQVREEILKDNSSASDVFKRPTFPKLPTVELDPVEDLDLIKAIAAKGMDGLLFIEGLMEFSDYAKWKRSSDGKPFYGKFNSHTDGKTSGVAILTHLLGNLDMSYLTGINRKGVSNLTDRGDVRDQLQHLLYENLQSNPVDTWEDLPYIEDVQGGNSKEAYIETLKTIALSVFKDREMHKYSIMKTPYGVEFFTLKADVQKTVDSIYQKAITDRELKNPDGSIRVTPEQEMFIDAYERLNNSDLLEPSITVIHSNYMQGLNEILSDFVLEYKSIARSFTKISQAINTPIPIKSMSGTDLMISTKSSGGHEEANAPQKTTIAGKTYTVTHYKTIEDMSATPNQINELTGENEGFSGGKEFSSAVAMLIHGVEADIIAKTASGRSLERLKMAHGESPKGISNSFFLPIFDAALVDIGSYDTVVRELNRNFDSALDYNPFEQMHTSMTTAFNNYIDSLNITVPEVVTSQDAATPLVRKRPSTDLLSDREKAFIVDLVSFNSLNDKEVLNTLQFNTDSNMFEKKVKGLRETVVSGSDMKFKKESSLVSSHKSEYFLALDSLNDRHAKIRKDQEKAFSKLFNFLYNGDYNFDVSKEQHRDFIYNSSLVTAAELDVNFLKQFLRLYRDYLFGGSSFERLRNFTNMTEENKILLRKEIEKNGYPISDRNGKRVSTSLNYYTI